MSQPVSLTDHRRRQSVPPLLAFAVSRAGQTRSPVYFSKGELSLIDGLYAEFVKEGLWRDRTFDSLPGLAVYGIRRHAADAMGLTIAKFSAANDESTYALYHRQQLRTSHGNLREVLTFLRDRPRLILEN